VINKRNTRNRGSVIPAKQARDAALHADAPWISFWRWRDRGYQVSNIVSPSLYAFIWRMCPGMRLRVMWQWALHPVQRIG